MGQGAVSEITEAEREELDAVLKAKVLARSPTVLRIAEYIARKYLEGQAASIKEYNIAVEALGKPADFDSKRDSIVRVEAHRLRKKLAEFYRDEGSCRTLRMVIDPGQYIPRFETNNTGNASGNTSGNASGNLIPDTLAADLQIEPIAAVPVEQTRPGYGRIAIAVSLALLICAVVAAVSLYSERVPDGSTESIWLAAGSPPQFMLVSGSGAVWRGDKWFRGGSSFEAEAIASTLDMNVPFQRRGNFDYDIPLTGAPHEMRLYFGPRTDRAGAAGPIAHGFDVSANGLKLINALDPDVGGEHRDLSIVRVFHDIRAAADGKLHLSFRNGAEEAYVNAIELTSGESGRLKPVRMVARAAPYLDPSGKTWVADRFAVSGGTLKIRTNRVTGGIDQNLVSGERYGTFTYNIPVSKGTYSLKLYFAESWFGAGLDGGGGVGSRRFDIYMNRTPLMQDFDIIREAGGSSRAVVKQFHGLTPDADGYIRLAFVPRVNHACVDALELTDETR